MDRYDLSQYAQEDHEFVSILSKLPDGEDMTIEIQDMDGNPLSEKTGEPIHVSIPKADLESCLDIMRDEKISFHEILEEALQYGFENEEPKD